MTVAQTDQNQDEGLELLTVEQVAALFKLAPRSVRFHATTQQLPGLRIGRSWRFRRSDLEAFLGRQRRNGR